MQKIIVVSLFIFLSSLSMYLISHFVFDLNPNNGKVVSPIVDSINAEVLSPTVSVPSSRLHEVIQEALEGTKGTYGIVVKHLETGESYYMNENRIFEPGSLYKVWVMVTAYEQIKNGTLKKETKLKQSVNILNDKFNIASEEAELTEGVVEMTVEKALEQMITISHNYAALLLSEKVRLSNVKNLLTRNNFTSSTVGQPPKTTPLEIALFFEKLYKGELADSEYTEEMINLLKQQRLNNKIPKNLPDGVVIAHKTGELGSFTHDVGIVYGENGDYLIALLSESDSPEGAEERIASVSEAVYEYFEN